jgi:hypothetical protein
MVSSTPFLFKKGKNTYNKDFGLLYSLICGLLGLQKESESYSTEGLTITLSYLFFNPGSQFSINLERPYLLAQHSLSLISPD